MNEPVIYISQETLSDSLTRVGNPEVFQDNIGELITAGFVVAIGTESAPIAVFTDVNEFDEWFVGLRDASDDSDADDDSDVDPELEAIEHIERMEELGWPNNEDETLSPKEMDQAEVRAGLRDPD
jgi:hypothetical protein